MDVSIVICTRNRAASLRLSLPSVIAAVQKAVGTSSEIIIVDNASTDETSIVANDILSATALAYRVILEKRAGLAIARNTGIRASSGRILVLTDDDCVMDEDYIRNLVQLDAKDGDTAVLRGGRVELGDTADLPLSIKTSRERKSWLSARRDGDHQNLGDCMLGANMSFRRALFEKIGPFDERMGAGTKIPGGEDTDYIYRAYLGDHPVVYEPSICVTHHHGRKTREEARKLLYGYSLGNGAIYAKYLFRSPRLIRQMYWDMKGAAREFRRSENFFMPQYGFSTRDKVRLSFRGMLQFFLTATFQKSDRQDGTSSSTVYSRPAN